MKKRVKKECRRIVSGKYYDELMGLIARTLIAIEVERDELDRCLEAFSSYLTVGVVDPAPDDLNFKMIMALMEPEIERAAERSARARRRKKPKSADEGNKEAPAPLNNNMQEIVFATNNQHKLEEIRRIVGDKFIILSLSDIGCHEEIPETASTLSGNALLKARYVKRHYGYDCFADDTGLMVDALGGAPGVYSARFAGPAHDSAANMELLLRRMDGAVNRSARFVTVIALLLDGEEHLFEGKVEGEILSAPQGTAGFGYDPVFKPAESPVSFACMSADDKNAISHRGRATALLLDYLSKL